MTQARRVPVRGRVQGVGFRAWLRDTGQETGVSGWVRNSPHGTVEAHLEGDGAALDAMIDRLGTGPSAARVDGVDAAAAEPEGFRGMEIRG